MRGNTSGRKREGEASDGGSKAVKLLITKTELDEAINIRRRLDGGDRSRRHPGPVADLLAEGGDAVAYQAYRRSEGYDVPGRWVTGLEALTKLRQDFGNGRLRSVEVRVPPLGPTDSEKDRLALLTERARQATVGRRIV